MALHSELPIYKVAYDLSDLAIDLVRNMPRDVKGVIGDELRRECLSLVVLIYRANVARDKVPHLSELLERVQVAAVVTAPVAEVAKISGASSKSTWVAELEPGKTLDDAKLAICRAIVIDNRGDLLALIDIDVAPRGPLNKLASALKSAFRVPCFKAVEKTSFAGARK